MKRTLFSALGLCIIQLHLYASHNKGGEITFKRISGLTYEVSLVTYTDNSSQGRAADKSQLTLGWGDGKNDQLQRVSRTEVQSATLPMQAIAFKNVYRGLHTYAAAGSYKIFASDLNRVAGVINMMSSEMSAFQLETELLVSPQSLNSSSVEFNKSAVEIVCVNKPFSYEQAFVNTDGDSLVFSLASPVGAMGFTLPTGVSIDGSTGKINWSNPKSVGTYSLGVLVKEFKQGVEVGQVQRELQLIVSNCPASTGLQNELGREMALEVFPNPASHHLGLKWQGEQEPDQVRVVDALGRECQVKQWLAEQEKVINLSLDGLLPGVYVLVCSSGTQVFSRRFIIE